MSHQNKIPLLLFVFLSLIFHYVIFSLCFFLFPHLNDSFRKASQNFTALSKKSSQIIVKKIDKESLIRLRTVGKKNGKKNSFSAPIPIKPTQSLPPSRPSTPSEKTLTLDKLGEVSSSKNSNLLAFNSDSNGMYRPSTANKLKLPSLKQYFEYKNNQGVGPTHEQSEIFKKSDFQITLDTPEGVELDKLNSTELIFYGFHKRVFESYISSIYNTYEDFKLKNPHIHLPDFGKQIMKSRVEYDKDGNLRSIKNIKISSNKSIQDFFEKILEKSKIPNPPKEILSNKDHFGLEFELIINSN